MQCCPPGDQWVDWDSRLREGPAAHRRHRRLAAQRECAEPSAPRRTPSPPSSTARRRRLPLARGLSPDVRPHPCTEAATGPAECGCHPVPSPARPPHPPSAGACGKKNIEQGKGCARVPHADEAGGAVHIRHQHSGKPRRAAIRQSQGVRDGHPCAPQACARGNRRSAQHNTAAQIPPSRSSICNTPLSETRKEIARGRTAEVCREHP